MTLSIDIIKGTHNAAAALRGKRVEIPVHYDLWMRGARFGTVVGQSVIMRCVYVRMDNPNVLSRL